jgi:hypothetical protein
VADLVQRLNLPNPPRGEAFLCDVTGRVHPRARGDVVIDFSQPVSVAPLTCSKRRITSLIL